MYQTAPISTEENHLRRPIAIAGQLVSFLLFISAQGRHRKITNAFGISRASVLAIIKGVSYAITNFLGMELIKFPTSENKNLKTKARKDDEFYTEQRQKNQQNQA